MMRWVLGLGLVIVGCSGGMEEAADGGGAGSGGGMEEPSAGTGSGSGSGTNGEAEKFGEAYSGGEFHLGPVDWEESQWHNACAPATKYAASVRAVEGTLLAGLWNGVKDVSSYCDACIRVETARGKAATLRVVTYGETSRNSIDVSPDAYAMLDSGEYPRGMTWTFTKCPDTGKVMYEFQTGSSEWWTSFWVRNARVPLRKVEVKSQKHDYAALTRGSDGTLTDAGGFGKGAFSIRLTGIDGSQIVHDFQWPSAGIAGQMLQGQGNFE